MESDSSVDFETPLRHCLQSREKLVKERGPGIAMDMETVRRRPLSFIDSLSSCLQGTWT